MALTLIEPPEDDPVSLEEAKDHCRFPYDDEDNLIVGLIKAATASVEKHTGLALITQTWEYRRDEFERPLLLTDATLTGTRPIRIPISPIQSVNSFSYVDADGETTVLYDSVGSPVVDTGEIAIDLHSRPARIVPLANVTWPTSMYAANSLVIQVVAGFGDHPDSVPAPLKQAILLLVGHWFQNRGTMAEVSSRSMVEIPNGISFLIDPYREPVFA